MMEAANTVKRYSAFPKTITSNPKSHFVFGVLPIAHLIHLIISSWDMICFYCGVEMEDRLFFFDKFQVNSFFNAWLFVSYTPWKINGWNQNITQLKRNIIFQTSMFSMLISGV